MRTASDHMGLSLLALTTAVLTVGISSLTPTIAIAKVGVTSATDGDPRGKPPDDVERVLRVGIDVQANELITTQTNDRAHLMFLDGTALTIGPNAQLTIDKFVYDPATKTGDLSISASKGVFRLVGGKISKTSAVNVKTPSSTLGIRGGISIFNVDQKETTAIFVFGTSMTVAAGGGLELVTRPGFQVTTLFGNRPGRPSAVPAGGIGVILSKLEGTSGGGKASDADASAQSTGFSRANSGQGAGKTAGDRFDTGPGPRDANPNNTLTNALTNAFETAPVYQPTLDKVISNSGQMTQTITYNGSMIGLVNNNGETYAGSGRYQQVWSMGSNSGATIANFDNNNYGGTTTRNGSQGFNAIMPSTTSGAAGRTMTINGTFSGQGTFPNNQSGAFTVNGPNYQAGGAFSGQRAP